MSWQIAVFILGTFTLIYISKRALKTITSHGFYRFFVFEGILSLLIINQPHWFKAPFSVVHVFSWLMLLASILLVIKSLGLLKKIGGHKTRTDTPENFSFENTTNLVTTGIYHYIRHPMYSSLFFLALGAFLKNITLVTCFIFLFIIIALMLVARFEEKENIKFFGSEYSIYMTKSKMFIPLLF